MKALPTKPCLICGAIITKSPLESRVVWTTRRKYCSRACLAQSKRGKPQTAEANEKRRQWSTGRKHTAENKAKFSGANCPRWTGGLPKCPECGTEMPKRTAKRCRECWYKWSRGENSPHWQGGKTSEAERIRKSPEYKAWRVAVFERDGYACQMCGIVGGKLHADHIKSFAYSPELRLDVGNGRTLCVPCHQQTATYMGRARWGDARISVPLFAL